MASVFGLDGQVSIPDSAKDSGSSSFILARKIRSFKCLVNSLTWVLSLEKISFCAQKHIKIVEIDDAATYRQEAEIGLKSL